MLFASLIYLILLPIPTTGKTPDYWIAEGDQVAARFGKSVSTTEDVNGDGFSDVIIGALWFDAEDINEGSANVYYGSTSGLSQNNK